MKKAERTKQFIIETAAPIFNEKGIAGTSIDDVLKVTKVAKGCLYGHFENKEALSYAMVDYLLQKVINNSIHAINKESSAKAKLFAYLDIYNDPNNPIESGCPIMNFGTEADGTNSNIKQKVKTAIKQMIKLFEDTIIKGVTEKEFNKSINAEELSLKIFTMIEGGIVVARVMENTKSLTSIVNMLKKEIETYAS